MRRSRGASFLAWAALPFLSTLGPPAAAEPLFQDATAAAGVGYQQYLHSDPPDLTGGSEETGGAAVADYNNDGWPDLFVTRFGATGILYRNRGDGTFQDVTSAARITATLLGNGTGWADLDNDGDQDLIIMVWGGHGEVAVRNYLYLNNGNGTFTENGRNAGLGQTELFLHGGTSVAFGDYDRDGLIDCLMGDWGSVADAPTPRLLRNLGGVGTALRLADATAAAGLTLYNVSPFSGGSWSFTTTFVDLDDDGWQDLAIAGDFSTSRMYWNDGLGGFAEGTYEAGLGLDEFGMGGTIGDFDRDGRLDWFVSSISPRDGACPRSSGDNTCLGNKLYKNLGDRVFIDVSEQYGVAEGFWGWGAAFTDYDNDGDQDLAMTNGVEFTNSPIFNAFADDPFRFWRNDGPASPFAEIAGQIGLTDTGVGKGLLTFDYDRDGDLDLFYVNNRESGHLMRNDGGNAQGWLRVKVRGVQTNRDGYGAKIRVKAAQDGPTQIWEIGSECLFLSQSERVAHFGLGVGTDPVHEVKVIWPRSGIEQVFNNVARNSEILVIEGVGTATQTPSATPSASPSATPTASATASSTPTPSPVPTLSPKADNIRGYLLGLISDPTGLDLNGDNSVDIADFTQAARTGQ